MKLVSRKFRFEKKFEKKVGRISGPYIPEGLIVSITSVKLNRQGSTVLLQVIRNKKVAEKYYKGINEDYYHPNYGYKTLTLKDEDAERFLEGENISDFTTEFDKITKG